MLTKTLFLRGIDGGRNINKEILAAGHEEKKSNVLKETQCTERSALLSYYVIGVHFTSSTTSGHCLSWKGGGEDASAQC